MATLPQIKIDIDKFLKDQETKQNNNSTKSPLTRSNYRDSGHSSVNTAVTSWAKTHPDTRDSAEMVDQEVPTGEFAPTDDGAGDKAQYDQNIETYDQNGTVGPLGPDAWNIYCNVLGQRESGNNYGRVNTIGYCGRWQFGAGALATHGYVRPGYGTRSLRNPNAWTGRDGISSRTAWLSSPSIQNKVMLIYTKAHYKTLLRMRVIHPNSSVAEVGGWLATAHLKGPGGARKLKNGMDNRDAYGTSASSYYRMMYSALSGGKVPQFNSPREYVEGTTQPDSASYSFPTSNASPRYPYNTITEYEGGHFKEYDSTPGNERIQERHKSGTGYEIMADGTERVMVTGNRYTAIMGSDYIMINGTCQIIVNGDCGLRVNGNLNQSVSNDYNLLVGGKFNVSVGTDKMETVAGNNFQNIEGDSASIIGGFSKVGVTGDLETHAASINTMAKDGNVNIGALEDINIVTPKNISLNNTGDTSITSKGKITTASGKGSSITSGEDLMISSVGGKSTLAGSTGAVLYSDANIGIEGSAVNVSPYVDRAFYTTFSAFSSALGATAEPPEQSTSGSGNSASDHSNSQTNTEEEKIKNAIELHHPFEANKTQSYAGGDDGTMKGYSDGFDYEASETI